MMFDRMRIVGASRIGTTIAAGTRTKIGTGIEEGRVTIIETSGIGEIEAMIGVDGVAIGIAAGTMIDVIEDPVIVMEGIETDGGKEAAEDIGKVTQEATRVRWDTVVEVVVGTVLRTINTTDMRRVRITATMAIHLRCQPPMVMADPVRGHLLHHPRRNPNRLLLPRAVKLPKVKLLWTTATCGMTENPASHLHRNLPQLHPLQVVVTLRMNRPWPPVMTKTVDPPLIWTRE